MHEKHLIDEIVRAAGAAAGDEQPIRLRVRLGELSHFSERHFVEHLADTPLAGVAVDFGEPIAAADPRSQSVLLESVTVA